MTSIVSLTSGHDGAPRLWRQGSLVYGMGGLAVLFAWLLLGDFAWSLKERAVVPVAQVLLKQLQASDFFIALVVGSLPAALGMLLGPVIAVRSDRHRGPLGRRIPYLLLPTPPIVAGLLGMAATPVAGAWLHDATGLSLRACQLGWFSLMWTVFEVASVTANAVFGGLINDVVPQPLVGRFYGLFRATSLLAGIGFSSQVLGHAEQQFATIFVGIAVIYGACFALLCWRVREGHYPPPEVLPAEQGGWLAATRRYLRECFSHRFYLLLFVAMMLGLVSGSPVNSFGVFYAKQVGLGLDGYGQALATSYGFSLVLALPVGWLADRFHPLRVGLVSIAAYAVCMVAAGLWVQSAPQFGAAFVLHGVVSGIYLTGTAALGQYLFPRASFAQFFSAMNLLAALGYMLVAPGMGAWLDATGSQYRHTFLASGALAAASSFCYLMVARQMRGLGGFAAYRAP